MSDNSFGRLFRVTTWGESHGPAIGCVIDGCPPRLPLSEHDIQPWLDRRRPGTSRFVTQRREPDTVRILSGVHEGLTTGTPIALQIENEDARSKDYANLTDAYRPGHADFTYDAKYGHRDPRGGGRSSARETAMRVAAGAVARIVLGPAIRIRAGVIALGGDPIAAWDDTEIDQNPFWSPDAQAAARWAEALDQARADLTSLGALIEVRADGVPPGWGAPIYAKLDATIAGALMSINAVKAVEIGDGFAAASARGHEHVDEMAPTPPTPFGGTPPASGGGQSLTSPVHGGGGPPAQRVVVGDGPRANPAFATNHAGGILGGISTGAQIVARLAIKPTASLARPLATVTRDNTPTRITTTGRHDPCVGIRAAPVAEAMLACVLADAMLQQRAQVGERVTVPSAGVFTAKPPEVDTTLSSVHSFGLRTELPVCFITPPPELEKGLALLTRAAEHLLAGDISAASGCAERANMPLLHEFASFIMAERTELHRLMRLRPRTNHKGGQRHPMPAASEQRIIYARDSYRCRYCGTRIILKEARDVMRRLLPDAVPWSNSDKLRHGGFFALLGSIDHVDPRSRGGGHSESNLVTACWPCNFGKAEYPLDELGIADPRIRPPVNDDWDGLGRLLKLRSKALAL